MNIMTFHSWFKGFPIQHRKPEPSSKPFVEVAMPQRPSSGDPEIEIELPNGAHVWIKPTGNNRELAGLIREVAGC